MDNDQERIENLGPAERILQTLLTHADHLVHNRPGMIVSDTKAATGVRWIPATWKQEGHQRVVYQRNKRGRDLRVGVLSPIGEIHDGNRLVASWRKPGLQVETAVWMWRQIADVFALDEQFVAHWASWSFTEEQRDLKMVLAAFMLVQSRSGQPITDGGEVLFHDDDLRAVGEAMCLIRRKDGRDLSPKLLLRIGEFLELPEIAQLNRDLGFGRSARNAFMGRWPKAVEKWLRHREDNAKLLGGLVKAGYRTTVMKLARKVGYKPTSPSFFEVLRWKQKQAADGRRDVAIGAVVKAAESWKGMSEIEICELIVATSPNFKRITGLLPKQPGLTRAIMAAAIEAGSLSDNDLIILTPTLEELGLLDIPEIGERWMAASESAENQRAANIAQRVRKKETAEALQHTAQQAAAKVLDEATQGLRIYCMVDISASMYGAIDKAKVYLAQLLQGFPLERLHACVFNTRGREVTIRHPSAKGVEHAFASFSAGGGTDYGAAVRCLSEHRPLPGEDVMFLFVGDEQASSFAAEVMNSNLDPKAFGFLFVPGSMGHHAKAVEFTASVLGIPCFPIDEGMFGDAYAVTRTLRHLMASTPVGSGDRVPLVEAILKTPLLTKPVWA
jgi:hypothetical protein